jgi:hypothetical protein
MVKQKGEKLGKGGKRGIKKLKMLKKVELNFFEKVEKWLWHKSKALTLLKCVSRK